MLGFREITEVKPNEKITEENERREREENGYRQIKPQSGMTVEEANAFWDSFFA